MTVKEAENTITEIEFIINELSIYRGEHSEELENNYDFRTALKEAAGYLNDYKDLLKQKIVSAILDM